MSPAENPTPTASLSESTPLIEYQGPSAYVSPGEEWSRRAKIAAIFSPLAIPVVALMSADRVEAKTIKDELANPNPSAYEQHLDADQLQTIRSGSQGVQLEAQPFGTPDPNEISKPFTAVLPVTFNKGELGHVDPIRVTEVPPPTATATPTEAPIPVEYEFNIAIGTGYSPAPDSQSPWQQLDSAATEGNYEYLGYVRRAPGAGAADFPPLGWRVFREKVAEGEDPKTPVFILEDKAPVTMRPGREDIRYEGELPKRITRTSEIKFSHKARFPGDEVPVYIPGGEGWIDGPTKVRWDIDNFSFDEVPNPKLDILTYHRSYAPRSPAIEVSLRPDEAVITTIRQKEKNDIIESKAIALPRSDHLAYELDIRDTEVVVTFYDTLSGEDRVIGTQTLAHDPYDRMEPYGRIPLELYNRITVRNASFDGAAQVTTEANLTAEQRPELNLDERINDRNNSGIGIIYDRFMPFVYGPDSGPVDVQGGSVRLFYYNPENIADRLYLEHLRDLGANVLPVLSLNLAPPGDSRLPIEATIDDFRDRVNQIIDQTADDYLTIDGVLSDAGNNYVALYGGDHIAMINDIVTIAREKGKKVSMDVSYLWTDGQLFEENQVLLDGLQEADVHIDRIGIIVKWRPPTTDFTKAELIARLLEIKDRWGVDITFHQVTFSEGNGPDPDEPRWWQNLGEIANIVGAKDSIGISPYDDGGYDRGLYSYPMVWDPGTKRWNVDLDPSKKRNGLYRRPAYDRLLTGLNSGIVERRRLNRGQKR